MAYTKAKRDDNAALVDMRARYKTASEACSTPYDAAREDIKFVTVPGNQWDEALKARRKNRPTYEFPKLRSYIRQIINEQRQSRPQGKVRGVEESDAGLAEIMQGLCRNIESMSNAEQAYDIAYEKAVKGGFGVFRICTDYLNDDDFEQDIRIKPVRNPFAVKFDPAAVEIDRRDGNFCFVEELIPTADFERRYPKANVADFESDRGCVDWREKGQVRVAEYWYKEPAKRELWALDSGAQVFADEAGLTEEELTTAGIKIVKRRTVDGHKVYMRLTNGREWLTDPYEFPSKFIPIVPVWGNIENIDGEDYWSGEVRPAKDQQRLHNVHRTALVEAVAKAPKAPFVLKASWIEGYEAQWKNANAEDYPYLLVKDGPGVEIPKRTEQAQVPTALIQLAGMDTDDMKASTGQYDASLGARSNETSGLAINSRKQQGATATFNYIDNLVYAIRYTYEILVDMIPRVYDTPRAVRILGEDGGSKWKQLYQEVQDDEGNKHVLNDIRKGKYDVVVTVGQSYATQRMEAVEAFTQAAGQIGATNPPLAAMMAYQVVKNLDVPGSEEVTKGFRKILVGQGLLEPAEGEQPPEKPAPDPRAEAEARKLNAQAHNEEAKAQLTAAQVEKMVQDTIEKMMQNGAMGAHVFGPPPDPYGPMKAPAQFNQPAQSQQPPQGGFSLPADQPTADPYVNGY
jgi:hypothetical protein